MAEYRFRLGGTGGSGRSAAPFVPSDANNDDTSCEPPRLKVLCVSADANSLASLCFDLHHMCRYEAQVVSAGNLALAGFALAADTFDVALVDQDVQGEAGMDLIRAFTSSSQSSCRAFVLMTPSQVPTAIEEAARSAGAAVCLSKEWLTPRQLEAAICEALFKPVTVAAATASPIGSSLAIEATTVRAATAEAAFHSLTT